MNRLIHRTFPLFSILWSAPVNQPSPPRVLLVTIPLYSTLTTTSQYLWARAILLETRGLHNPILRDSLTRLSREIRRTLIKSQEFRYIPETRPIAGEIEKEVDRVTHRALQWVPPGRPTPFIEAAKGLNDLIGSCKALRSIERVLADKKPTQKTTNTES